MPRAIVIDLFGVIASTQQPEDIRRIEEVAGLEGPAVDTFWDAYWARREPDDAGQAGVDYWAAVAGRLGVPFADGTVRALIEADMERWSNADAAMVVLIGELAAQGLTFGFFFFF